LQIEIYVLFSEALLLLHGYYVVLEGMYEPYLPISVEEVAAISCLDHWTNK
jgi:hypothetical protein